MRLDFETKLRLTALVVCVICLSALVYTIHRLTSQLHETKIEGATQNATAIPLWWPIDDQSPSVIVNRYGTFRVYKNTAPFELPEGHPSNVTWVTSMTLDHINFIKDSID